MPIQVRPATTQDLDWLIGQLKDFAAFYASKRSLFGEESYVRAVITSMIERHLVLVAERGTELLGFIGGIVTPHFMNPDIQVLTETFWWVSPEHRRTRAGLMLLEAFVGYGKANAQWTQMTLEHESPVADRCLTKRGFQLKEHSYLLEVC